MTADYERYVSSKSFSGIDPVWKKDIESDIASGQFVSFTSANSLAKQFVIFAIDKNGYDPKVRSLGCSVHKIALGEKYEA